jgi:hypothetical protein
VPGVFTGLTTAVVLIDVAGCQKEGERGAELDRPGIADDKEPADCLQPNRAQAKPVPASDCLTDETGV